MLMIEGRDERLSAETARRVTLKVPFRFICMTLSHSSGSSCSTGAVGPDTPALLTRTSKPPMVSMMPGMLSPRLLRSATSHTAVRIEGCSNLRRLKPSVSMSTTVTSAPRLLKASAIACPIPDAPAVISTFCLVMIDSQ
ncbi:hypothetical protein D3C73_1342800 [compost metagenome]